MTGAIWPAIISGISSLLLGWGAWVASARKVRAETARTHAEAGRTDAEADKTAAEGESIVVRSALEVIEALRTRIDEVDADMAAMKHRVESLEESARTSEQKIRHLEHGVEILTGQVIELGDHPRWPNRGGSNHE